MWKMKRGSRIKEKYNERKKNKEKRKRKVENSNKILIFPLKFLHTFSELSI